MSLNPDEVKSVAWVSKTDLEDFLEEKRAEDANADITPWFRMLKERKLYHWWTHLEKTHSFPPSEAHTHIERFL